MGSLSGDGSSRALRPWISGDYARMVAAVDGVDLRFVEVAADRSLLRVRTLTPASSSLVVLAKQSRELQDEAMLSYLESICVPLVLVA